MEVINLTWDEYIKGVKAVGIEFAEMFSILPSTGMDIDKMDQRIHLLQELPLQRRLRLLHQIGSCIDIPADCLPPYVYPDAEKYLLLTPDETTNAQARKLMDISYYLQNFASPDLLFLFFYCLGFDRSADSVIERILEKRKKRFMEFGTTSNDDS